MAALVLENVSHAFGALEAVSDVSLTLQPGELVCLLGPSGCGKTTLLRLAAGLEMLQRGRIAIAGKWVAEPGRSLPPERRGVGLVFQDFALFPHLTVAENVAFGLAGRSAAARRARVLALLDGIGLAASGGLFPHTLSGGQQQRVALVRALAPEPNLVLLDEPFSGLDSRLREQLREDFLALLKATGVTALMVTHDAEEAMYMSDRIAVMDAGRFRTVAGPHQLYFHPADAFVAGVFGEPNRLAGRVADGCVATPLGPLPAAGLAEGCAVEVLVRPEGVSLLAGDAGVQAVVRSARMLGRASVVLLDLPDVPGAAPLRARVSSLLLPAVGERVRIAANPRLVHVFPAGPA